MSLRYSGFVLEVGWVAVGGNRNSLPIEEVKATISMPYDSFRTFSAIAPAATRPRCRQLANACSRNFLYSEVFTDCFPRTTPSTSATGLYTIFLKVRPICVAWPGVLVHRVSFVVVWSLVLVHNSEGNRGTQRDAEFCSRLYFNLVLFISWCRNGTLSWPSAS